MHACTLSRELLSVLGRADALGNNGGVEELRSHSGRAVCAFQTDARVRAQAWRSRACATLTPTADDRRVRCMTGRLPLRTDDPRPSPCALPKTAVGLQVETSDYNAALQLRDDLQTAMRKALSPMVLMVIPVLAGAAPRVPSYARPLSPAAVPMADMSQMMTAFVAMTGCPAAVLPVPAITARGAPWAVLLVGCYRCDLQVAHYSSKMGDHIQKTVQAMIKVRRYACRPCMACRIVYPGDAVCPS